MSFVWGAYVTRGSRGGRTTTPQEAGRITVGPPGAVSASRSGSVAEWSLLLDDREHVAGREDEEVLAVVLDLGAAVLAVDHDVTDGDVERHARAVLESTRTDSQDGARVPLRSEEHTSELQSLAYLVCRLLLEKKKHNNMRLSYLIIT